MRHVFPPMDAYGAIKHHSIGTKVQETPQANAEDPQSSLVNVEVNIK